MTAWAISLFVLVGLAVALLLSGLPVAVAFLSVDIFGAYWFFGGGAGLRQLVQNIEDSLTSFNLVSIPLFILMGEFMFHTRMGARAIEIVEMWFGRIPGRLSLVSVFGGAVFSTLSGSSVATTAFLGSQLLPEMRSRGYKPLMSVGPLIGSGGLAMMIPPSALAILLAALMSVSAGDLLIATILPGVLMAICYVVYIVAACTIRPDLAPAYEPDRKSLAEKLSITFAGVVPLLAIVFVVVGLIFLGVATPSESAALGALATALLGLATRRMDFAVLKAAIMGTMRLSTMMMIIIAASVTFGQILAFSGATSGLLGYITAFDLEPWMMVIIMQLILLVLGCFMDNLSMVMIAIPIFLPLINAAGLDPMWFAVVLMINMDLANLTPPFGLLLLVMRGVAPPDISMRQIYQAAFPFVICDLVVMGAVIGFPEIATFLPSLMP